MDNKLPRSRAVKVLTGVLYLFRSKGSGHLTNAFSSVVAEREGGLKNHESFYS